MATESLIAPAPRHHSESLPAPQLSKWIGSWPYLIAVALGLAVRLTFVLGTDFPLHDGGLFYTMVRDLQQNGYALPLDTTYNSAGIPFPYPPLGFYLAGWLDDLTALSLLDVFRFLPLAVNVLTIAVFALLSREILGTTLASAIAVFVFAVLPRGFQWLIMGGGLTRSLGLLFAVLALWQVYLLYRRGSRRHLLGAIGFSSLTALSHLETTWFLAYSIVIFWMAFGRNRTAAKHSALLAAGTLVGSAPWWVPMLWRHGPRTLLNTTDDGWPLWSGLHQLLVSSITQEVYFPALGALAALGFLVCLARLRLFLPVWLVASNVLDPRSTMNTSTVILALLAAVAATEVLLPLFRGSRRIVAVDLVNRGAGSRRVGVAVGESQPRTQRGLRPALDVGGGAYDGIGRQVDGILDGPVARLSAGRVRQMELARDLRRAAPYLVLVALLVYSVVASVDGHRDLLVALSPDEREAMAWLESSTPPDSTVLVVSSKFWATDPSSEWLPTLAERVSVATVQGREWLPGFGQRVAENSALQDCAGWNTGCLDARSQETGLTWRYVYLPRPHAAIDTPLDDPCWSLRQSLFRDSRYSVAYDGPGATIFALAGGAILAQAGP